MQMKMSLNLFRLVVTCLGDVSIRQIREGENVKKKLFKPIEREFLKVMDSDVSIKEKREILSKPQVGHGIFTLLASTILPTLISSLLQNEIKEGNIHK